MRNYPATHMSQSKRWPICNHLRLAGSPFLCAHSTTPSYPLTNHSPNWRIQPRNQKAKLRALPHIPCRGPCSTRSSCQQTIRLANFRSPGRNCTDPGEDVAPLVVASVVASAGAWAAECAGSPYGALDSTTHACLRPISLLHQLRNCRGRAAVMSMLEAWAPLSPVATLLMVHHPSHCNRGRTPRSTTSACECSSHPPSERTQRRSRSPPAARATKSGRAAERGEASHNTPGA